MTENQRILAIVEQSKNHNNCLTWLHICQAECCKQYILTLPPNFSGKKLFRGAFLQFKVILTDDKRRYYKLHSVICGRESIKFTLNEFKVEGNTLTVYTRCKGLTEDLKCKFHGTDRQPKICHTPSLEVNKNLKGAIVTENCLYRWK